MFRILTNGRAMLPMLVCTIVSSCGILIPSAHAGLVSRIEQSADAAVSAYSYAWRELYGQGRYSKMYCAALDLRPDKQPNIILDKKNHAMEVVVGLSVNEANYDSWKKAVCGRFKSKGLGCVECDARDTAGRMIGGVNYKFGENEEAAIRRWEKTAAKEELVVSVRLVDQDKDTVREKVVSLDMFSRAGSKDFSLPYYGLNRLRDLPTSRFRWKIPGRGVASEDRIDQALAKVAFRDLDDEELGRVEDVVCVIRPKEQTTGANVKSSGKEKPLTVVYWIGTGKKVQVVKKTILGTSFGPKDLQMGKLLESVVSVKIPRGVSTIETGTFSRGVCPNLNSVELPDGLTDIGGSAFSGCKRLQRVVIPSGVVTIGGNAFSECLSLKSIDLPSSLRTIGNAAFADCRSLKTVSIPDGVVSVGPSAFARCERLESVSIPNGIKGFGRDVFSRCTKISSASLPLLIASGEIGGPKVLLPRSILYDCKLLKSITIVGDAVDVNACAFSGMKSIEEVVLPATVTNIQKSAFAECTSLKSMVVPPSVRVIGEKAFYDCSSLTSVVFSEGLKVIDREAFANCRALRSIAFPDSVETIARFAFAGCSGLKSVELPAHGDVPESETFKDCSGLRDSSGFIIIRNILYNYSGSATDVVIPDGVTAIADRAFYRQHQVQSVTMPEGVVIIGWGAFAQCVALKKINIPTSAIRRGGSIFEGCRQLEDKDGFVVLEGVLFGGPSEGSSLVLPSGVREISAFAFSHNHILKSVTIPEGVEKIGKCAFSDCKSLETIKLPLTLKQIGTAAFQICNSLSSVTLPPRVEYVGDGAFYFCGGLKKVLISDGVVEIGDSSFMGCKGLECVSIPGSVRKIGDSAFCGCRFLQTVTISPGVGRIGCKAFRDCPFLRPTVVIPASVTEICDEAFCGCTALVSIDVANKKTTISKTAIDGKTRIQMTK